MVSRDDVLSCYRILLDREAECDEVIDAKCQSPSLDALIMDMVYSREFMERNVGAMRSVLVQYA